MRPLLLGLGLLVAACGPTSAAAKGPPAPEDVRVVADVLFMPVGDTHLLGAVSVEVRHEGGPDAATRRVRGAPKLVPADGVVAPSGLEVLAPLASWYLTDASLPPGESATVYLRYLRMRDGGPKTVRMRVSVEIEDAAEGKRDVLSEPFDLPWAARPVPRALGAADVPATGGGPVLVALRVRGGDDGNGYLGLDVGMDSVARAVRLGADGGSDDPNGFHETRVTVTEALALRDALRVGHAWELAKLRMPPAAELPPDSQWIELFAVTGHSALVARFTGQDPDVGEHWPALREHLDGLRKRVGRRAKKGPR